MESKMDIQELIDAIHIAELSSTDRPSAIRELVGTVDWAKECVAPDDVVNAIEEREATAQNDRWRRLGLPPRNDPVGR